MEILEKQRFIFGSLFLLANKLQVILDRNLAPDLTAKQWFLTAVIDELFEAPPTLNEVAAAMGSSHQNVKQLALKLQEKGFLQMEKDEHDRRALRLKLTEKSSVFWEQRQDADMRFFKELFKELTVEEINAMHRGLSKLITTLAKFE